MSDEHEPQKTPHGEAPPSWEQTALHKADRLERAKRQHDRSLYTLAHVGVLAWLFIIPVLVAGWLAHLTLRETSQRWIALPLLVLGVVIGGALVRRKILAILEQTDDGD